MCKASKLVCTICFCGLLSEERLMVPQSWKHFILLLTAGVGKLMKFDFFAKHCDQCFLRTPLLPFFNTKSTKQTVPQSHKKSHTPHKSCTPSQNHTCHSKKAEMLVSGTSETIKLPLAKLSVVPAWEGSWWGFEFIRTLDMSVASNEA